MPEEIKLSSYDSSGSQKNYKSDYYSVIDDSNPDLAMFTDHSDREMSRSETSSCSDESGCYKQNGHETVEVIPTRTIKTSVPKPAANPLQFVKIGPCDLYRSAQKQLQKTCEVKKPKQEIKNEIEDWQSNLDSWKCNRRKQQEHIIERVVEVKKLELEEHDRNRKRTKTFSEMMEERTSKGRKLSLPLYVEEDSEDLSDLGLSSNKNEIKSSTIPEENDATSLEQKNEKSHSNNSCIGFNEPDDVPGSNCESTYESAIQSYESRMKSIASGSSSSSSHMIKKSTSTVATSTTSSIASTALCKYGRRSSATKIEQKLSELERIKNRSISSTDLTEANKKQINIPKVNIFQRKEIFEKISDINDSSRNRRLNDELPPVRSIRERLSTLGKTVEETTTTISNKTKTVLLTEVSVKDRLSSINEKIRQQKVNSVPTKNPAIKEQLSSSDASSLDEPEKGYKSKDYANCQSQYKNEDLITPSAKEYSSSRSSSSEDYDHVHPVNHFHHRSLDSLQGHDSPNGFCFERVQSLECIDCCSNYPASVLSGDTDREDSGIHTADVSSSVSQADDFDLHADTSIDVDVKSQNTSTVIVSDETKADSSSHSDFRFISQHVVGSLDDVNIDKSKNNQSNGQEDEYIADVNQTRFSEEFYLPNVHVTNEKFNLESAERVNQELIVGEEVTNQGGKNLLYNCTALKRTDDTRSKEDADINNVDVVEKQEPVVSLTQKIDEEYLEEPMIKEEITSVLNEDHSKRSSYLNEYVVEDEKNLISTTVNESGEIKENLNAINCQFIQDKVIELTNIDSVFDLEPSPTAVEPPKEKPPPPPPLDNSDEESIVTENTDFLRRMDSTKRIKKEMRQKRSSFLGIERFDDDSYLEPDLELVKPPPDMTTFLQEERRLERLLYRQSICSESDSTQGESRDSGVELDKNQNDENSWMPECVHSRQDSETYANNSSTSEEDEIIKKEREILEILELEEQRHYETESKNECNNLGEKLVLKLKELEQKKNIVDWGRENEQQCLNNQYRTVVPQNYQKYEEPTTDGHYQLLDPIRQSPDSVFLQQQWIGRSLQDISQKEVPVNLVECRQETKSRFDYRSSMPNIQQETLTTSGHNRRQPPPVPTNKPSHFQEPVPVNKVTSPQQMSKQTLQALSAVPRSKIVAQDSWVLSKKKPRQDTYNYQHWLIQEAEHRRITEYQQKQCVENNYNYMNIHSELAERSNMRPNNIQGLECRITPNSNHAVSHPHLQVLPYRHHCQVYNDDCKNQMKSQYNSNNKKPLPDSVIQTLTQRVQNRFAISDVAKQKRRENYSSTTNQQEKMLSVSGKKKCSHCGEELGRGAAMIIESLRLFYHIDCFKCCVCCVQLGDGLMGTDVRVRNSKLHCHSCYSNDEGLKFSCV